MGDVIALDKSSKCLVLKPVKDKMERLVGSLTLNSEKNFMQLRKKAEMLALEEVKVKWGR